MKWRLKEKKEKISPIDYIPLHSRIEWIARSVLGGKQKPTTDDVLAAVFTNLKGSRLPENEEILGTLRKIADPKRAKNGKWYWKERPYRIPKIDEFIEKERPVEYDTSLEVDHGRLIGVVAKLGQHFGHDIWIGKVEQRKYESLRGYSIGELSIPGVDSIALERISQIDTIWLLRKTIPEKMFEVEATNPRYAIQRMANVFEIVPHLDVKAILIVPDGRRDYVKKIVEEPSMKRLVTKKVYCLTFSEITGVLDEVEEGYKIDQEDLLEKSVTLGP